MKTSWSLRLALLVYLAGVLWYRDAVMDDTFIHLQYARNLRAFGELAFNRGEPSLGFTSPLWMLLLAALGDGLMAARLASVACGALSVIVFHGLARRTLGGPWAVGATIAWSGSLWLVRHAPNGMEATLATLLVLVAIDLRSRLGGGARRDAVFGLVIAAAVLTRPEALLLGAVFLVHDVVFRAQRSRLRVWVPVAAATLGVWIGATLVLAGQVVPGTGTAKSGGFVIDPGVWWTVCWREVRILASAHGVSALGMLVVGAWWIRQRRVAAHALHHPLVPYAAFSLLVLVAFVVNDVQVQPRYLLPVMPCGVLLGFAAWRSVAGSHPGVVALVTAASLATGVYSGVRVVHPMTRDFSRTLVASLRPLADELRTRAEPGACVATPDIGYIGYFSGLRVVDLGGLIEPRIQRLVERMGYDAMLRRGAFQELGPCAFLIDRSTEPERFRDHRVGGTCWRVVRTTELANLGISRPGPFYYTLYAIEPCAVTPDASSQAP